MPRCLPSGPNSVSSERPLIRHFRNVVIHKKDVISYRLGKLEDALRYYSLIRQTDEESRKGRFPEGPEAGGSSAGREAWVL